MVEFSDIMAAGERICGAVYCSPCPVSQPLSEVAGCEVYCKLDYLQRTGSFKERGACNALMMLDDAQKSRGVIAASAGNHALGLAYHAGRLGIPVTVVMPKYAPLTKVSNCQKLGAKVLLFGDDFPAAYLRAKELEEELGLRYINGYNDSEVIAGQGTMGLEIIDQVKDLDAIVVPIGGGGLIAGVAMAIKAFKPDVKVYGVEPVNADCFHAAMEVGEPVDIEVLTTLADGLAVSRVGERAFDVAKDLVDEVVVVEERDISLAVLRLAELEKSVVEGAGAVGLAACMAGLLPELEGKKVVLPLTGGNIDTTMLGRIIERGLVADGRLCQFEVVVSDRPGGLAVLTKAIADEGGSIKDISHDRVFCGEDLMSVGVNCVVETRDFAHIDRLKVRLEGEGLAVKF